MKLTPISADTAEYPMALRPVLAGAELYDSSCSPAAKVVFIDRDGGYFLKSAVKGALEREAAMTRYFHGKGLAANVLSYISEERDWLLTERITGDDCTAAKYLDRPERLADTLAERLASLHLMDCADCPVPNHTERYFAKAEFNKRSEIYDTGLFSGNWGCASVEEAWRVVKERGYLLRTDTLLHGDYCLPNIILADWRFSGFIDLDQGGVGDRHVDVFWGAWTLFFNLKTDRYRDRFIQAYEIGSGTKIDGEVLRVVAACEVFG